MNGSGSSRPTGSLGLRVIHNGPKTATPAEEMSVKDMLKFASPQRGLDSYVNGWRARNLKNFARGLKNIIAARALKLPSFYGRLSLVQISKDGSWVDLGLVGLRMVTTAGVGFIVDAFQDTAELELQKFHAIGTGTGAEAV